MGKEVDGDDYDDDDDTDGDDEIVQKKDGGIHGVPLGAVHSMYYAKVWWGENTPMHIMQYKKYKYTLINT